MYNAIFKEIIMESDLDYVRRKLQDPIYNIGAIANQLNIQRYRLDKIIKGGDAKYSLIETLSVYFKNIAA
jgi:hypothetical protein